MYGLGFRDSGSDSERERLRIVERAEKKYGGVTTSYRVVQSIKSVCQKFDVADLVTIDQSKGIAVLIKEAAFSRMAVRKQPGDFYAELIEAIYDCGYNFAVGSGFFQVYKA